MITRRQSNARSQVQRVLAPLVESKVGPEQAERYRRECDKRTAGRKRAVVLNLVAALDERLILTAEQRAALVQSLSSDYQNSWDQWFEMFAFGNPQYLPFVRDESIAALLNVTQKSVWQQVSKLHRNTFSLVQVHWAGMGGQATEIQEIARMVEEAQDDK